MSGVSTIELLIRMTVSLAVIGGLLWMIQQVGRKRLGGLGRSATAPIEVSSRKQLSRTSSIALVRVGERNMLIGVTDAGVSLIAEGDDLTNTPDAATAAGRRRQTERDCELLSDLAGKAQPPSTQSTVRSRKRTKTQSGLARKPGQGAKNSTHSGTRALDALREMTVRKT